MINTNIYIKSLEGRYIYRSFYKNIDIDITNYNKEKLYSATMPYSLETIRADEKEIYINDGKQYTDLFVNVTFEKDYYEYVDDKKEIIAHKSEIREHIYQNGFTVCDGGNVTKYVFYKRGPSKAKTGSDIFIKESHFKKSINRSRLNIEFKENESIDLTSLYAYDSLSMSGLDFIIDIKPDEILIIDDIYGEEFETLASVTKEIDKKIITQNDNIKIQNCLTDGQGLLDESVFNEYEKSNKGFMLLRSDWMKSCAFNTKLRAFWKDRGVIEITEKINGISTGRILDTEKIKLVITPNSLKWLKLAKYKFNNSMIDCYLYWINNIDSTFGVVKTDKQGNFGTANRMTYQLLNSLPLTYNDVKEIAQDEINYVRALKNDFAVFKNHIGQNINEILEYEEDIDFVTNYRPEAINIEQKYKTKDMVTALLSVNSDFRYTDKFKDWKKEQIDNYIDNLRYGKLRIKNTIYVTMLSNPYEMLLATIEEYIKGNTLAKGREIWCSHYEDGQEFCASRNPHINMGNVAYLINKKHDEYTDWFNLSDNCCIVNFADNDLPDRLQGCDTDSDQMILIPLKKLVALAKDCEKKYPTPINRVKGKANDRPNNMIELAKLDQKLSNNYIGSIVNKSQIINSYIWDAIAASKDQELIDIYYTLSSKLSSLSQIEIDRSKKSFDNISISKELRAINDIKYKDEKIFQFKYCKFDNDVEMEITEKEYYEIKEDNRKVKNLSEKIKLTKYLYVPIFFNYIANNNAYNKKKIFNTPMDHLQEYLDKEVKKPERIKKIKFKRLLVNQKTLKGTSDSRQVIIIHSIIEEYGKRLNGLKHKKNTLSQNAKDTIKNNLKKNAIEKLKALKINNKTILLILRIAFKVSQHKTLNFWKYSMLTLNLLYCSHQFATISCFINKGADDEILIRDDEGDIDIFGTKYRKENLQNII